MKAPSVLLLATASLGAFAQDIPAPLNVSTTLAGRQEILTIENLDGGTANGDEADAIFEAKTDTGNVFRIGGIGGIVTNRANAVRTGDLVLRCGAGEGMLERMRVTNVGNVGIGTSAPANQFHVLSASNAGAQFQITSANPATGAANLILSNVNTTVGNASGIEFVNGGGGPTAFISGVNYNHNTNGSTTGGLDFAVYNAGTLSHPLTIAPSGYIGIGTTSPTGRLQVIDSSASLLFRQNAPNAELWLQSSSNVYADLHFATVGADQCFLRGSTYGINLTGANPRLAVGGTDVNRPGVSLYVKGLEQVDGPMTINATASGSAGVLQVTRIDIAGAPPAASGTTDANQFAQLGNPAVSYRMGLYQSGDVWLQPSLSGNYATNLNTVLNPNGGNVIIGVATVGVPPVASNKLTVFGTISAKEIKVTTTGADYVFENGYRLRPLAEIERFVLREKHLPEIMSAKDMQDSGLPVSEVVTKQLAKIEELTLYAIDLEKKNAALERKNTDFEARLGAIEASLEALAKRPRTDATK